MTITVREVEPFVASSWVSHDWARHETIHRAVCSVRRANGWTTISSGQDEEEARRKAVALNRATWPGR